jgi:hypothetical protein
MYRNMDMNFQFRKPDSYAEPISAGRQKIDFAAKHDLKIRTNDLINKFHELKRLKGIIG